MNMPEENNIFYSKKIILPKKADPFFGSAFFGVIIKKLSESSDSRHFYHALDFIFKT